MTLVHFFRRLRSHVSVARFSRAVALLVVCPIAAAPAFSAPSVTVTKSSDAAGVRKSPGGTITYTVTVANGSGDGVTSASDVVLTDPTPANTAEVAGSLSATPVAIDDAYPHTILANTSINTALNSGYSVVANDFAGYLAGSAVAVGDLTIAEYSATSANGGTVTMTTTGAGVGRFTYVAPAGFTGTDTFTYIINRPSTTESGDTTASRTATVSITVSGPVTWFVNASAAADGTGTQNAPFQTLAAASAAATGATDRIFLYPGNYTGGVTLTNGVRLFGQGVSGASFDAVVFGVVPPMDTVARPAINGTDPVITMTAPSLPGIRIANTASNVIAGLTIGNTTAAGITMAAGATSFGTLTISDVTINGTGPALNLMNGTLSATFDAISKTSSSSTAITLTNIAGNLNVNSGSLANVTGDDIVVNGGSATINYGGSITNTASRSINIQNRTGGTITFSGAVSDTGTGILLNNNTGSTIAFTGGLSLSTTTNAAFTATGGGTITATQNNTSILNTIATSTGVALNVTNTSIGAAGLTFRSISANGASSGIVLNNTGASFGLTVTGDTGASNNGSGGLIQNTSGPAVSLTNTAHVSFDQLNISSSADSGINGTSVANFSYTNGTITNAGNSSFDSAIAFNGTNSLTGSNLTGTLTVTGSIFTNAFYSGIDVQGDNGTVTHATVTNNTFTNPGFSGINFAGTGTASTSFKLNRATISGNTVSASGGNGIQVSIGNANASGPGGVAGLVGDGSNVISISGNFVTLDSTGTQAITVANTGMNVSSRAQTNFLIQNNGSVGFPLTGSSTGTVVLIGNNGYATMTGTISGNIIDANHTANIAGGNGIGGGNGAGSAGSASTPDLTLTVSNNTVTDTDGNGILLVGRGATGTARLKIQNNNVAAPLGGVRPGIRVDAGNASSVDDAVFLNISGNTSGGSGGHQGIGLRKQGTVALTNDFGIQGMVTSPASAADMQSYVASLNPGSAGGVLAISGSNFVSTSAVPLLFAARADEPVAETPGPASSSAVTLVPSVGENETPTVVAHEVASSMHFVAPSTVAQVSTLTQLQLDQVVRQALARWEASGLTEAQRSLLRSMRFEVASLSDLHLGEASAGLIQLDADANGRGWFIEGHAVDEAAFARSTSATRHLADDAQASAGRLDLLTAIMHEMGHALGLEDLHSSADRENLMFGFLTQGERRMPAPGQALHARGGVGDGTRYLSSPITIGTLPKGKSTVITFQVAITARANIASQATASGSNFTDAQSSVVTTEVQQAPVVIAVTKTGNEDATITFSAGDFMAAFSDPNPTDTLASVTITSLPTNGVLKAGETNIALNATIAAANLGTLTYTPTGDYHGSDSFLWTATDNYASDPLSADSAAAVNITVAAVAEAPSVTATTTAEDTQTTAGLVVSRGAADTAEVTHFKITDVTGGLLYLNDGTTQILDGDFITFAQANAGLKFTPSADLNTAASDTFEFAIAGATDAAGAGLGAETVVTMTVTEVNDAPVAATDTLTDVAEDAEAQTFSFASLVGNDSTGPANESVQSLTITAVANPVGGTVAIDGTNVIFTPALNFAGTASFDYTVTDNGTTNSAADAKTATGSVSLAITAVNDIPTVTAPATLNGTPNIALEITGVTFADIDAATSAVTATFTAPSGTLAATSSGGVSVTGSGTATITLGGTVANLNAFIAAENLTFTSTADTTVSVSVDDEGSTGTGGAKTATAEIEIVLNRAPVAGFGGAFLLEKSGGEGVEVSHNAALNLGTGSFTIEAWVKRASSVDGFYTILGKQAGSGGPGFYLRFNTDKLSFAVGTSADANWVDGTLSITDTSWHHVAAVMDASAKTMAVYVDGVLDRSASFATAKSVDNAAALGIGFKPGYGEYFDGTIDEVRIWSTARSASQITEYMRVPLSGAETGLVAYWNFEGTGATVANTTANAGLDGTIQNAGGGAERVTGSVGYSTSVAEDSAGNVLRVGGNDVEDNATTFAKITTLPAHGKLFHADGTTEITSASVGSPVEVIDAGGAPRRVVYVPEANYVGADSFSYIVNDGSLDSTNTQTVNITVSNVNDAPVFTSGATFSVAETATNAAAVGDVDANDGDGGSVDSGVVYSITGGTGESLFSINASTGAITVNATGANTLDYEVDQSFTLTVRADDGGATSNTADQSITINITDGAPSVTASQSFSMAENSVAATAVGTVVLTGDTDSITWSIQSGNTAGAFSINSSSGQITVASAAALNYESTPSFTLGVRATDGSTNSDQSVTINLTNVNEAPSVTSGATASFNENDTSAVYTATGSDPDTSTTLTFVLGGTDAADFTIDANTGAIAFAATPNYEAPADADADNVYDITVTASDGALASAVHAVTITVNNVNETPLITSGATASFSENATGAVYTATGSDPDATTPTFSLGGTDAADFSINANTGVITFAATPNYESPADADTNNVYDITVTASDGTLTSSPHAVSITVSNVNETPSVTSAVAASAAENQSIAYTVAGSDPDAGATLSYSITGGDDVSLFTIDPSTGVVSFVVAPDFELPDDANEDNVYGITVTASDGTLTSSARAVDITVTDAADAPIVTSGAAVSVGENQTSAYTVAGIDQDSGSTLTYAIGGGADAARFTIDANTGVVTFSTAPDFEAPADAGTDNVYDITVTANDGALTSSAHAVAITVTNVNETPSVSSGATANAAENQTTAYTVTGADPDAGTTLTFAISGGADADLFAIDPSSGAVTFNTAPNFESRADANTDGVYKIEVTASDGTLTSEPFAVAITVADAPETPTVTSAATASPAENQTTAYTVIGGDADADTTFIYAISGGADAALFTINASTGVVTFNNQPDFETPRDDGDDNVYNITVTASDGTLTSVDHAVAITVTDVNETPTITSDDAATFVENATGTVYTATGTDPDASTTLTFALGGADAALFNLDADTGIVTFISSPNFEAPADAGADNVYDIAVTVSDSTLTSAAQAVAITVTNTNDAPTDIALSANSLNQSQSANAEIGTLTTTDEDTGEAFVYSLVSGSGSDDNASFNLSGDKLRANEPSSLAPRNYSVRVRTADSEDATFEKVFSVVVTDDVAPTITAITGPAADTYGIGQTLEFSVTFTEAITVVTTNGTPVLNLTLGGILRTALYADGSGTTTLLFRYVIQAGDSTEGGELTAVSLTPEGGTIKDASGNNASLTFTAQPFSDVIIEARFHSADTDHDWHLSLFELTRVIELYNTRSGTERTGEYHSTSDTEDGFAPGAGVVVGHHSADTNEDGRIDLSELTRVIELYNTRDGTTRTGEYHRSLDTDDGFDTGPESRR